MNKSMWDKIKILIFEATDYTKRGKPRVRKTQSSTGKAIEEGD